MSKLKILGLLIGALLVGILLFQACGAGIQVSQSGAVQRAPYPVSRNAEGRTVEQQQIWDRQRITMDFTKVMWIHLIALDGKIIKRMPVRYKITSSGKRLEPVNAGQSGSGFPTFEVNGVIYDTIEFLQADGTYGESDNYVYWFDPMGRYHQWGTAGGLGYLLTDYPIDLANPMDEITGLYNMHEAAFKWQQDQEAKLREEARNQQDGASEINLGGK